MKNYELLSHLDQILQPDKFKDYCPNGLQIEGDINIDKIVTGVSLNDELINHAILQNANAIVVHHGIFWTNDNFVIRGIKHKRIAKLLNHGINLYAYHLPLDNHPAMGNNIQLANLLNIKVDGQTDKQNLLWYGKLADIKIEDFIQNIAQKLNRTPLYFAPVANKVISTVAWCTGGAESLFTAAINLGVDLYLTGEAAEPSQAMAIESNVIFVAAGHYATERYGIMALSEYISQNLDIETKFIELYNPV